MNQKLKAPFPAFGGKSRVAGVVWQRLGRIRNYVEPFCFSAAMLLLRPDDPQIETVNDLNAFVANFWRAVQRDPESVAHFADWPVNETDLHARHAWLVRSHDAKHRLENVRNDPDFYDARIAGWWCWGACMWIGSGWCDDSHRNSESQTRPDLGGQMVTAEPKGSVDWTGRGSGVGKPRGIQCTPPEKLPLISTVGRGVISERFLAETDSPAEKLPAVGDRSAFGRGVITGHRLREQLPDLSGEAGATGRGILTNASTKRIQPCSGNTAHGPGVQKRPRLSQFGTERQPGDAGCGVHSCNRPQLADAYSRGRGVHGNDNLSDCEKRTIWLTDWFARLSDRLRSVRVCCGHWARVCDSDSTMTRLGTTGVFLDPPYIKTLSCGKKNRSGHIYANDRTQDVNALIDEVQAWCLKWGNDPRVRIAVCGLDGEYPDLDKAGWETHAWKAHGGYGNRNKKNQNADRERIWFSPHCEKTEADAMPLFHGEV